ncbi:MAG: PIN domain-containing protein, partial [Hydrogenophaga sp.]|nr:PIN domain-containing protein [Hydrogenophaga sp.]
MLVLDTNIALDLFVFQDAATEALRQAVERADGAWIATAAMREELVRVLDYPQIARRLNAQARP